MSLQEFCREEPRAFMGGQCRGKVDANVGDPEYGYDKGLLNEGVLDVTTT